MIDNDKLNKHPLVLSMNGTERGQDEIHRERLWAIVV
jgi:hypothetical protein